MQPTSTTNLFVQFIFLIMLKIALNKAIEIAEGFLDRDLTDFESSTLYNEGEFFIDEDHDNRYTVIFQETE